MRTFEAYSVTRILRHHLHAVLRRLVCTGSTAAHFPRRTLTAVLGTRYSNILAREHLDFIYCAHAILVTSSPPAHHVSTLQTPSVHANLVDSKTSTT